MATNRNKPKREIEEGFSSITLPDKNAVPSKEDLPPIYENILEQLRIHTRLDLRILRDFAVEQLMKKQEEERAKLLRGIMDGTITDFDNLPLMRNEKEDGTVDMKIPDSMMPIVAFVAWLNEKAEEG